MKSAKTKISITINNDISELNKVNRIFEEFTEAQQLPLNISNPASMALDEIVNNIISYGYDDQKVHKIEISIELSAASLKVQIKDDGIPFNPLEVKEADVKSDINERAIGGVGLHLIKNMMDRLNYTYKNKKNCLVLEKNMKET